MSLGSLAHHYCSLQQCSNVFCSPKWKQNFTGIPQPEVSSSSICSRSSTGCMLQLTKPNSPRRQQQAVQLSPMPDTTEPIDEPSCCARRLSIVVLTSHFTSIVKALIAVPHPSDGHSEKMLSHLPYTMPAHMQSSPAAWGTSVYSKASARNRNLHQGKSYFCRPGPSGYGCLTSRRRMSTCCRRGR